MKLVKLLEDFATNSTSSTIEKQTALYGIKLVVSRVDKKSKAFYKVCLNLVLAATEDIALLFFGDRLQNHW